MYLYKDACSSQVYRLSALYWREVNVVFSQLHGKEGGKGGGSGERGGLYSWVSLPSLLLSPSLCIPLLLPKSQIPSNKKHIKTPSN